MFESYRKLLTSKNYVARRQSLKVCTGCVRRRGLDSQQIPFTQLLGELLLDRANFNIMTRYISDAQNLKMMMILLRDNSRNIQFEAFHVFKVRCRMCVHVLLW